jgi:hypothetical protein
MGNALTDLCTRVFKKASSLYFLKNLHVTDIRTMLLFNIISLLDTFSPAICKLHNAVGKESLWLTGKPVMHCLLHLIISCKSMTSYSILEGSKQMEITTGDETWVHHYEPEPTAEHAMEAHAISFFQKIHVSALCQKALVEGVLGFPRACP